MSISMLDTENSRDYPKVINKLYSANFSSVKTIKDDVLIYVRSGYVKIQSTEGTNIIREGSACYLKKGEYFFDCKINKQVGVADLIIISYEDSLIKIFIQRYAEITASILKDSIQSKTILVLPISLLIKQTIESIYALLEYQLPVSLFELKLEELLLLLVYSDSGSELCKLLRSQTTRSSERLHLFMENYFLKDWKLSEFAKEFGASLTTFKELFHEVYGVSPRAWITERRLLYAYNLLLCSETRIVDVALESGFSSQSYFTQSYRRRFGVTPSKVRSELGMTDN